MCPSTPHTSNAYKIGNKLWLLVSGLTKPFPLLSAFVLVHRPPPGRLGRAVESAMDRMEGEEERESTAGMSSTQLQLRMMVCDMPGVCDVPEGVDTGQG